MARSYGRVGGKKEKQLPDEQIRKVAKPPEGTACEWCDNPATLGVPFMRRVKGKRNGMIDSGIRAYACSKHQGQAERQAAAPMPSTRK